jgi:hypothetical protein
MFRSDGEIILALCHGAVIMAFNAGRFRSDRVRMRVNKIHDASTGIRSNGQLDGTTG